ncbi:MAG: alpha-glucosidase/alpha-galactosidase [Acidimicrobiales bacterium]|jgi:alpha-galactosidase
MTKIAIVGAGSLVFTRALVSDLLQQEPTADAEIHLVDIDDRRLGEAVKAVEAMAITSGRALPLVASTDCAEGVRGCNYVVNTIQVGGKRATAVDFDLPEKFGVQQTIADTHGIGGISRALRTLPAVLEICGTVAEHAPDAYLLNYTNPMAMVVMGIARSGFPRYVGLCHGTEHTAADIAGYLAVDQPERLTWQAAGINHMTWFLELDVRGEDVYPRLREFARRVDVDKHPDGIRLELLRRFGYFVSESSVHNAEYYPWFLRQGAEAEAHGVRVREYLYRLDDLEQQFEVERATATSAGHLPLPPQSTEYAPRVIAALESGATYRFMGNLINSREVISNLPDDACVEVPCFVDGGSIIAGSVGRLPEQCAALNRWQVNVQLLAVEGILEHRRDTVYQAAFLDPLLSSQLTLDEITSLVDELIVAHGNPSGLR